MEGCLKAVEVIFKKFFAEKESSKQLACFLKKRALITEGLLKRTLKLIEERKFGKEWEKIIKSLHGKSMEDLQKAVTDPEFPAEATVRDLLKQLTAPHDAKLEVLIHHWDDISNFLDDLLPLLKIPDGTSPTGKDERVLEIVFLAASQLSKQDTTIYDSVTEFLAKKGIPIKKAEDKNVQQASTLKRPPASSEPQPGPSRVDTPEEAGTRAQLRTSENKRKLDKVEQSTSENSKRTCEGDSRGEMSQQREQIPHAPDPNNNNVVDNRDSQHLHDQGYYSTPRLFYSYPLLNIGFLQHFCHMSSGQRTISENARGMETAASCHLSASLATTASQDVSAISSGVSTQETVALRQAPMQEENARKMQESLPPIVERQSYASVLGRGSSVSREEVKEGARTRLMAKKEEESNAHGKAENVSTDHGDNLNTRGNAKQKSQSREEIECVVLKSIPVEDPQADTIEFRVIIGKNPNLSKDGFLCIVLEHYGWKEPIKMEYNEERGYYYVFLPCPAEDCTILYKFCWVPPTLIYKKIIWESLPCYDSLVNRCVDYKAGGPTGIKVLNVSIFSRQYATHNWTLKCCESVGQYLPVLSHGNEGLDVDLSFTEELFSWVNCVKHGWMIDRGSSPPPPTGYAIENILVKWLESIKERMTDSTKNTLFAKIVIMVVVALRHENHHILRGDFLSFLFNGLNVRDMDATQQVHLYEDIAAMYGMFENRLALPMVPESLDHLFVCLCQNKWTHGFGWLHMLPLYWLFMNKGQIKKKVVSQLTVHSRASLPSIKNVDWETVRRNALTGASRPALMGGVGDVMKIATIHPWLVGTFQYMLSSVELFDLLKDRENQEIVSLLRTDAVFSRLVECVGTKQRSTIAVEKRRVIYDWYSEKLANDMQRMELEKYVLPPPSFKTKSNVVFNRPAEELNDFLTMYKNVLQDVADILTRFKKNSIGIPYDIMLWCVTIARVTVGVVKQHNEGQKAITEGVMKGCNQILTELRNRIHKCKVTKEFIKLWGELLSIDWALEEFQVRWKEQLISEIRNRLGNHRTKSDGKFESFEFLQFYEFELEDMALQSDVKVCFDDKAFECATELISEKGQSSKEKGIIGFAKKCINTIIKGSGSSPVFQIFERLFVREYDKTRESLEDKAESFRVLTFLLDWSFSVQFYNLFGDPTISSNFKPKAQEAIECVAAIFKSMVTSLCSGKIEVKLLEILLEKKEKFLRLCEAFENLQGSSVDGKERVKEAIKVCSDGLATFNKTKKLVSDFIEVCGWMYDHNIMVQVEGLHQKASEDVSWLELPKLVSMSDDEPSSTAFFGLTESDLEDFSDISYLKESSVFQKMLIADVATAVQNNDNAVFDGGVHYLPWKDTLRVCNSTRKTLLQLVEHIDEGSVSLSKMIDLCENLGGDSKRISGEMKLLYGFHEIMKQKMATPSAESDAMEVLVEEDREHLESVAVEEGLPNSSANKKEGKSKLQHIRHRITQIYNLFQSEKANDAIGLLLRIRDTFKLEGPFDIIEDRLRMMKDKENVQLSKVPQKLEIPDVCNLDKKELEILEKFLKELDMIEWLKEKMKEISEVKVMCDLAMISAGESPADVDRVSFLLSAVLTFAPLIFGLEKSAGIEGLLEKCKEVWKNVESNPGVLQKWEDTSRQLHWLKELDNFHGSVEKLSLTRAQEINQGGTYLIRWKNKGDVPTLENCVVLTIQAKNPEDSQQTLTLAEAKDLQSRLMLITGDGDKGQHDVNQFIEVLTSIQKLTEVFVQLLNAGCMLFGNWSATIMCAPRTSHNLQIEVKFSEKVQPLTGSGTHNDINMMAGIMKKSLGRWNEYISKKRLEHYYLNEFSIQQILYLCRELALCVSGDEGMLDQVCILLSSIASKPNFQVVMSALEKISELKEAEMVTCESEEDETEEVMEEDNGDSSTGLPNIIKKKRKAVFCLIRKHELEELMAKAAVQAAGYEEMADCINWAFLNENESEMIIEFSGKYDEECAFTHEERAPEMIQDIMEDHSLKTLDDMIQALQRRLNGDDSPESMLDAMQTICMHYHDETTEFTLYDYLSIDHFGKFLEVLQEDRGIRRKLTPPMKAGRPNLLICTEQEMLTTVLSLYMNDKDQQLPTSSEVLVCSEATTADEVERFMRRAMCECDTEDELLFCLAFADKLGFNVATATEEMFLSLSREGRNENYQLVILLSNQQHYLNTCFDKYVVDGKWVKSDEDIATYLKRHLTVDDVQESAAFVDNGRSMVKVVSSSRSGVGKSLHVQRLSENLATMMDETLYHRVTIRLLEKNLSADYVIDRLSRDDRNICNTDVILVHLDLTPAVQAGIENFAFNLLVLGSIQSSRGKVWKRHPQHLYIIEMTDSGAQRKGKFSSRHILKLLPTTECIGPRGVLGNYNMGQERESLGMDEAEFRSETFQRPFQYLSRYEGGQDLDQFTYSGQTEGDPRTCIALLLRHCCMKDPSWAQLRHFVSFLNVQLQDCEKSIFCNYAIVGHILKGLKAFAVKFMIRMSQDFATPSLKISDKSLGDHGDEMDAPGGRQGEEGFENYQMRRRWEESQHPYLFFNEDHHTITFINIHIDDAGNLLDKDRQIMERNVIPKELVDGLKLQKVQLNVNFDSLSRREKLKVLCLVMGIDFDNDNIPDPDPTYELTTDNVLKILAIYMRFRCQIPVIIMGETGCGKTRMVEFMSKLKAESKLKAGNQPVQGEGVRIPNMIPLKIHGGIVASDIYASVRKARENAAANQKTYGLSTILFYDEANTTEAIYAIKEVMCDLTIDGESFHDSKLQIVAACNPYKQLPKDAIKKLEDSGLGYRIRTSETEHLFGNIPIRTLVYRVVALPPSMQPFIWDFGQLGDEAEKIYIQQMTKKLAEKLGLNPNTVQMINKVLSSSQSYMRNRKDECRYVSLRDVERCMLVFEWFHNHKAAIYHRIENNLEDRYRIIRGQVPVLASDDGRTLLQTVSVCYHASLDEREPYRELLSDLLEIANEDILEEFKAGQMVFLENLRLDNIACNEALRENVFMMVVCADMRIPLFLIGKPGSSKSLAKTVVMDNMQGAASRASLYKELKQVHMLSYQCSALTDAAGIMSVFNQCARLQERQNLEEYTAVVILDEIGLAEDSANMPLKILHPLLECGNTDGSLQAQSPHKKVGFVGISNWALDPAKMNRGIFVTRVKPTEDELKETALAILDYNQNTWRGNKELLDKMTDAYLEIYSHQEVEYFGLRDYYSLIKMIHSVYKKKENIGAKDVARAVQRNFSGGKTSCFEIFQEKLGDSISDTMLPVQEMIRQNLEKKKKKEEEENDSRKKDKKEAENDSRFLLLLSNQFSVVSLLHLCIEDFEKNVQVVFGSSFPGDHNYTEICRNINRIKACMETGKTVVLLNMTEIHESLYDALNQHYVTFGGQKYVDLGLGGHRVKCRIAQDFRLIVIEKKDVVYREYPIPLINRLEKHHFSSESLLTEDQKEKLGELSEWVGNFAKMRGKNFTPHDAFVGYHDDTGSSVVLMTDGDLSACKDALMQCCAMDGIFRLSKSGCESECDDLQHHYLHQQCHDSLLPLLRLEMSEESVELKVFEIVSYSNVLSQEDRKIIEKDLDLERNSVMLLSLEQFNTEQEYLYRLDEFFKRCRREDLAKSQALLLIQCSQAQSNGQLVACAKHCLMNKVQEFISSKPETRPAVIVAFLLSTERQSRAASKKDSLVLQHTRNTTIIYIDELKPSNTDIASASHFHGKSLCDVLTTGWNEMKWNQIDEHPEHLINMHVLLQDSICEAVAMIKTPHEKRYFDHVKILTHVATSDEDSLVKAFRGMMLEKMAKIYREREDLQGGENWIVEEACKRESLQEGGTFRKTLWLCLRHHTARLLAYIVSSVDAYNNLDIVFGNEVVPWKANVWLKIFQDLPLQWESMMGVKEFSIPRPNHSKNTSSSKFPFGSYVTEIFLSNWKLATEQNPGKKQEVFKTSCRNSPLFKIFADIPHADVRQAMETYAKDLAMLSYTPGSDQSKELDALGRIVYLRSMKIFKKSREESNLESGDEISFVFLALQEISRYLPVLSKIFEAWPEVLEECDSWIEEQGDEDAFIIHIKAATAALESLKKMANGVDRPESCAQWQNRSAATKRFLPSLLDITTGEEKGKIITKWTPLSLLDLLLLELLPSSALGIVFRQQLALISRHAKQLWKGSERADVRSYQFLRIICNVLKKCHDDIRLSLFTGSSKIECLICRHRLTAPSALPCGHVACSDCLQRLLTTSLDGLKCPRCSRVAPEDFTLELCVLTDLQNADLVRFKSNCTSFFLEYLDKFCFSKAQVGSNSATLAQMQNHVETILKELVVRKKEVVRSDTENRKLDASSLHLDKKRELDASALHLDINTRSYILRILLEHNRQLVFSELDAFLKTAERDNLQDIIITVVHCFESRCIARASHQEEIQKDWIKHWEKILGNAWRNLLQEADSEATMGTLENVSHLRCALTKFVHFSNDVLLGRSQRSPGMEKQMESFMDFTMNIVKADDAPEVLRYFIIKTGCQLFGMEWFHRAIENDQLHAIIPPALLQATEEDRIEYWALSGARYKQTKTALYQSSPADLHTTIEDILNESDAGDNLQHVLSVFAWARNRLPESRENAMALLQDVLGQDSLFYRFLNQSEEIVSILQGHSTQQQAYVLHQLITTVVAITSQPTMQGFNQIMTAPAWSATMFLPAMPENLYFAIPAAYRRQHATVFNEWNAGNNKGRIAMYECPNGHYYGIGDCTRPASLGTCPECGAQIGGHSYNHIVAGNKQLFLTEQSQKGYLLNKNQKNSAEGSDRMTKQGSAVAQFLLHACLLVGSNADGQGVSRVLGVEEIEESQKYLVEQMLKNLQDLSEALGRNIDEAVLILHKIIHGIPKQTVRGQMPDWSSMENRRAWEQQFRERFFRPVFENLDAMLQEAEREVNDANDMSEVALYRLVHEIPDGNDDQANEDITWDHGMLWKQSQHPNSAHLLQYLGDASETNSNGAVLQRILQTRDLHYVKHLKDVLELQQRLIARYQNEIDLKDAEERTFEDHITDGGHSDEKLIQKYISIWNQMCTKMQAKADVRLGGYFDIISQHSPIAVALPSTRGRGQCAKIFSEYLIDIQNDFLIACKEVAPAYFESIREVDVSELSPSQFVSIDKQHDLRPLIQMHTRYDVKTDAQGRHHCIAYNVDALEKQVREKFVIHKKLISKKSLPCIRYPQDVGIGADWEKVATNIKQQPLTAKLAQDVDGAVKNMLHNSSDVCEAVRTLTHAISFLAKVKRDPAMNLCEFLEKELLLPTNRTCMIPRSTKLEQTLSIYQRLSWHKAVNFSQQGLDPYKDALATVKQEQMDEIVVEAVKEAFRHIDVHVLQQRLNEMLINVPEVPEEGIWGLKYIIPEIPFIDSTNDDTWYKRLPDEICFKHVSHLFSLAVQFSADQTL